MSDFLSIRLRGATLTPLSIVSWVVLDPNSSVVASGDCLLQELPEQIPAQSGSRRVIVLAPTEHLLLTRVSVPEGQRRHLKQVLPFMIEEKIIDPIESMHIATPAMIAPQSLRVGCIRREMLAQWLDCLAAVDIQPDYLFADAECIDGSKGDWQLFFDEQRVLLGVAGNVERGANRIDVGKLPSAMAMTKESALPVIQMTLAHCVDEDELPAEGSDGDAFLEEGDAGLQLVRPASVALVAGQDADHSALFQRSAELLAEHESAIAEDETRGDDSAEAAERSELAESFATAKPIDPLSEDTRSALAEYLRSENIEAPIVDYRESSTELLSIAAVRDHDQPLNFLQGEFTPLNANAATRRFMRRAVMASAACLALFLGFSLAGGFYLENRAAGIQKKSVALYKELFPGERVRDPVRQMRSKLKSGNVGASSSDFLPLLDVASRSLQKLGEDTALDTTIKQLRYDAQRGSVTMELQAGNIDQLESYRDLLANEGLAVDILSANQDGDIVNGRLQIGRT